MTYPQALHFLESFVNYEKVPRFAYKQSFKLERMQEYIKILGSPQESLRCIHIVGSKGKGSTAAFCAYILKEAGFKTGLYTSPHLSDFRERIRILTPNSSAEARQHLRLRRAKTDEFEGMISEEQVCKLVEYLKPKVGEFNKTSKWGFLSFFEVYTALAFLYFKERKVDFAVIETGLGGRLDATNVISPLVCAVTSLSLEHTDKLGRTLKEIAREKCGIIKEGSLVVSAPQEKEAQGVIRNRCQKLGAKLYEINPDEYPHLKIKLLGRHQLINAGLCVGIIEALRFHNIFIKSQQIREGLKNTVWPGRLEVINRNPLIVLDGAQNPASALVLKKAVKEVFTYKKLILVLGVSCDKDIRGVCSHLKDISDIIILTKADNPRAASPDEIKKKYKLNNAYLTDNIKEALNLAQSKTSKDDLILVTGSLFIIGEARDLVKSA